MAKGLEAELLIAKGSRIMLMANLWTEAGLVNRALGTIVDIVFEENGPPSLPTAVFVNFNTYEGVTVTNTKGIKVVPIGPIKQIWEGKNSEKCSRFQVPIWLAWAITVHKSQGLTLSKAKIDIGSKEFAAGLLFVTMSRVLALKDIYFKSLLLTDYNV